MNEFALFESLVGLSALAAIYSLIFLPMRRDDFRTDIRRLRDRLFDVMWQNRFDYNNRDYCDARQTLNGLLRMSNELSPFFVFSMLLLMIRTGEKPPEATSYHTDTPQFLKIEIEETRRAMHRRLVRFLFLEGVIGLAIKCVRMCFKAFALMQKANAFTSRAVNTVLTDAYYVGGMTAWPCASQLMPPPSASR